MNYVKLITCIMFFAALSLHAGTIYYFGKSGDVGEIGDSNSTKSSLHAQFAGTTQNGRPAFAATGDVSEIYWKFERKKDDNNAYEVKIDIAIYAEPDSKLDPKLFVAFDEFTGEHKTESYFRSNDSAVIHIADAKADGNLLRLSNSETLIIPATMKEFYVFVRTPTIKSPGVAGRVESISVAFRPVEDIAANQTECPYWSASRSLKSDVVALGADPTGISDSSAAFQKALDQGGFIAVPMGKYRLDNTLIIKKSHTYLIGEGLPELIRQRSEGNYTLLEGSAFAVRQISDIRIANLALTVPGWQLPHPGNPSAGISLMGFKDVDITNCVIRIPAHDGIRLFCGEKSRVSHCTTYGGRHGITVGGNYRGYQAYDTQFVDNQIYYSWDTGIVVGILTNQTIVSNNLVSNIGCHAIDIFNCKNVTVSGNLIRNWLDSAINFDKVSKFKQTVGIFVHTDWGIIRNIPTENITISGNTLICDYDYVLSQEQQETNHPKQADIYYSPIGIQITGDLVKNVTVTGNTVKGGAKGFYVSSLGPFGVKGTDGFSDGTPQNITCVGNTFQSQTYASLEVDSREVAIKGLISNNLFVDGPKNAIRVNVCEPKIVIKDNRE